MKKINLKLTLPFTYLSRNSMDSMHWAKRMKWIKKYKEDVGYFLNLSHLPALKLKKCTIEVDLYFKENRRRDIGNYDPKYLVDALVDREILSDDNCRVLEQITVNIHSPAKEEKTVVEVIGWV